RERIGSTGGLAPSFGSRTPRGRSVRPVARRRAPTESTDRGFVSRGSGRPQEIPAPPMVGQRGNGGGGGPATRANCRAGARGNDGSGRRRSCRRYSGANRGRSPPCPSAPASEISAHL